MNKRLYKDPKIHFITCEEFYEKSNYLHDCKDKNSTDNIVQKNENNDMFLMFVQDEYYKITSTMFIKAIYGYNFLNYGTTANYCLQDMYIALRDGNNEFKCLDSKLQFLINEKEKHPRKKSIDKEIQILNNRIKYIKRKIPQYTTRTNQEAKTESIDTNIIKNLYQSKDLKLSSNYVVLDLETNGLRRANDDILSITIYDPSKGEAWNKFMPLELQPIVLNPYIHGITNDVLKNKFPLTQNEFNNLIDYFDLKNKKILTYSGGQFDYEFLSNYFKRHNLVGLEELIFQNIKNLIASNGSGNITKDNLCKILNIENVTSTHSGLNDCILEWKLFEKIHDNNIVVINNCIYSYSKQYKIPISYLIQYSNLEQISGITLPDLNYSTNVEYEYNFPQKLINKIKKFDTNISGIQIEHIINTMLKVKECDNKQFLIKNKQNLKLLGYLDSNYHEININKNEDGSLSTTSKNEEDKQLIDEINAISEYIKEGIIDLIDYIKNQIFKNDTIQSQELVFSHNDKIFALCDLSSKDAILEIKTYDIFGNNYKLDNVIKQLYYESNNRKIYVLSCIFEETKSYNLKSLKFVINSVDISIIKSCT